MRRGALSHVHPDGRVRMVPVGAKPETERAAVAEAVVSMRPATLRLIRANRVAKGNVFEVARIAAIQAAKQTAQWIPLCHPIRITHVGVEATPEPPGAVRIVTRVCARDRTGVEMEALTAAAAAGLAIYDMCKAVDRGIEIRSVRLLEKKGGRSGHYRRDAAGGVDPSAARCSACAAPPRPARPQSPARRRDRVARRPHSGGTR